MKLWIDDIRPAPQGYWWIKSVNQFIDFIQKNDTEIEFIQSLAHECFLDRNYKGRNNIMEMANRRWIEIIDIDHDAGDYKIDGGDYIKILDWLEENNRNFPIRIHSMNPVGVDNMRRIIQRNNWKEIR